MSITTYGGLKTAITDWINWDDMDGQISTFIALAEARINREVRHWKMDATATLSVSTQYTALPADFMDVKRVSVTDTQDPLRLVSVHDLQDMRDAANNQAGAPYVYAISNGQLEVFPTPDTATDVTLHYVARIAAFSADGDTNWLLTEHPDVYLYGSLMQAAPYLAEDQRTEIWATLYTNAVMGANQVSDRGRFGGAQRKKIRTA